ncbi:MAG: ABC transporter substrate-binding protein, partial [Candidatus Methanoperedens sp.]|nr:ABC transporter substrate-binding protein [Candidatus Methanoperedens sp.]
MERRRTALALALVMSASSLVSACGRRATPVPTPTPTAPPVTATSPAADDWARVRASGRLMVGSSLDNPPLSMYNNVLQPDGFEIALMKEIGRRLSLQVEFNDFAFEGLLSALQLNQVDAVIAAMSITPERQQEVDFTNPYFIGEDAILAAADSSIAAVATVNDLAARRVGVQRGSVYESWLRDTLVATGQMPQFNLLTYISLDEAIRDLRDGRVELVALDLAPAQHYAERGSGSVLAQNLHPQRFGIAVQKGSSLLPQLNQALQQVQADGTVGRLLVEFNLFSAPLPPPEPTPTPAPTATPAANTPVPATAAPPAVATI